VFGNCGVYLKGFAVSLNVSSIIVKRFEVDECSDKAETYSDKIRHGSSE
jgi:hypothetical protein